jgi:hypothetical protein
MRVRARVCDVCPNPSRILILVTAQPSPSLHPPTAHTAEFVSLPTPHPRLSLSLCPPSEDHNPPRPRATLTLSLSLQAHCMFYCMPTPCKPTACWGPLPTPCPLHVGGHWPTPLQDHHHHLACIPSANAMGTQLRQRCARSSGGRAVASGWCVSVRGGWELHVGGGAESAEHFAAVDWKCGASLLSLFMMCEDAMSWCAV